MGSFFYLGKKINMKKITCILAITLLAITVTAQSFEGKVVYQNSFKSKVPNVSDDMFTQMMGTSLEYFYKNGNYRTTSNGTLLQWQIYSNKENKIYTKVSNSPAVFWNDGSENKDEVVSSELNKNAIEVLGHKCDELILNCKSGVQKYYYSSKFKIDPKLFEKHKFGNFYDFISKSSAVPLKIIVDNAQFTMESVASSVEQQNVDEALFTLPADATFEKNPFN
jgi:hypothetical protein